MSQLTERNYPRAITPSGSLYPDHAQRLAIEWTTVQRATVGGTALLYVPLKSSLNNNALLGAYSRRPGVVVGTSIGRITGWSGGPVLAAWPTRDKLALIADDRRTRALCVIPWNDTDTAAWQHVAAPDLLGEAIEPPASTQVLDPVVVEGLKTLSHSVNHGNNLASSLDHRDAVAVLRELHRGGYSLPPDEVYVWALKHDWQAQGAARLRDLAGKIDAGKTVQLKGGSPFKPDILDQWKARASSAGTEDDI